MAENPKRESATISFNTNSTHETTMEPYVTAETAIHEAALVPDTEARKRDMSVSERSAVPYMTAIVPPAEANYRCQKKMCSCCRNRLCCAITIVTVIVLIALLLFLALYIFKARKPKIIPQDVKVKNLSFSTVPPVSITLSLEIDTQLKNPNYAGWKYQTSNTSLYYHGPEVGVATVPAGEVHARSSAAVNILVDVDTTAMTSSNYLLYDLRSGVLPLETYTVMTGKVLIINIIKIHATVYMNCSVNVNLLTWDTATQCKSKVHL